MKCKSLLLIKIRKNIINLSSVESAQRVGKVKSLKCQLSKQYLKNVKT